MLNLHPERNLEILAGRFGQLTVSDCAGARSLCCGWACHGSSWLAPAAVIDGVLHEPGPVPETIYLLGWLLAAAARPDGHVLMAGLGSGAGPIALAWAFPHLRVTVVEIDPATIAMARRHFPLLGLFEGQGRIRLVEQDIVEHVWCSDDDDWSLACLDAYQDTTRLHCPSGLLQGLHGRAEDVWMNILEEDDFQVTRRYADILVDCGWEPACVMPVHDPGEGIMCGNVLLGTRPLADGARRDFRPFAGLDHGNAERAHGQLIRLASLARPWSGIAIPREEIEAPILGP